MSQPQSKDMAGASEGTENLAKVRAEEELIVQEIRPFSFDSTFDDNNFAPRIVDADDAVAVDPKASSVLVPADFSDTIPSDEEK